MTTEEFKELVRHIRTNYGLEISWGFVAALCDDLSDEAIRQHGQMGKRGFEELRNAYRSAVKTVQP
jgi:hypothetical protein